MDKESGMMAIVHGLKGAGLKVTVIDGRSQETSVEREHSARALPTEANPPRFHIATSNKDGNIQICDGRYTSSYQLAHCSMKPTSPAVSAPEFPIQKLEPCRNSGNFEIGDSKLMRSMALPSSPGPSYRYSLVDTTPTSCHTSRESEFFANTLRKYPALLSPSASPERSMSSELVQRLISYTQNKNLTKSSYHTKNNKSQYTEGRGQKRKESPTRDISSYTNDELRNSFVKRGTMKNNQLYTTISDTKYVRYKDKVLNCNYDYLKSTNMKPLKKERNRKKVTEVRYLNDITKSICETLRNIYEDKPTLCPNIRSRYCQHQRSYHGKCSNLMSDSSHEEEAQAQFPSTSRATDAGQSDILPDSHRKICDTCNSPSPCGCKRGERIKVDVKQNIYSIISEWEKEIPVHGNELVEDKTARKILMQKLADTLQRSDGEKYRDEIMKCLKKLPMWKPEDKSEKEKLIKNLADSLLQKLENISDGTFHEEVKKFVDSLPLRAKDENEMSVKKEKIITDISKIVKYLALSGLLGENAREEIFSREIETILENLPLDVNEREKKEIIKNLGNAFTVAESKIPPSADGSMRMKEIKKENDKIENDILNTAEDSLGISTDSPNVKKMIQKLSSRLAVPKFLGLGDDKIKEEQQTQIDDLVKDLSPSTDADTRKMFINNLTDKINDEHKHQIQQKIQEAINDIFDTASVKISPSKKKDVQENIAKVLVRNLSAIKSVNNDDVKNTTLEILDQAGISGTYKDDLANQLINAVKKNFQEPFITPIKTKLKESIKNIVKNVLNASGLQEELCHKAESKLTNLLTDQIMRGTDDHKLKQLITGALPADHLSEEEVSLLSNKLLGSAKKVPISLSPNIKDYKQDEVTNNILRNVENVTGEENLKLKENRKTFTDKLFNESEEILYNPSKTYWETENLVNEKVSAEIPKEDLSSKFIHRKDKSFKTSSPRHSADTFFKQGETIPSIIEKQRREEEEYVKNITEVMQNWADDALKQVNKNVKDGFVNDLIAEVINRKKYLQAFQRIPSDDEDIDFLNYQIYKLMNNKIDKNDLVKAQLETKNLMKNLKSIPVPEPIIPIKNKDELDKESQVAQFVDVITKWLQEIPPYMFNSNDLIYKEAMLKQLAEKLHHLKTNRENLPIDAEIKTWLKLILNDHRSLDLTNAVKSLRVKLGLPKAASEIFDESYAKYLEEYLIDVILSWVRNQKELYQRRNSTEKVIQIQLITALVQNMLSQLEPTFPYNNLEELWLHKITTMLKEFPMDPYLDSEHIRRMADQLLNLLKVLPVYKEISDRCTSMAMNRFNPLIEDWINSLPLNPKSSLDHKEIEGLKKQLLKILKLSQDQTLTDPSEQNKEKIKAEILKYMSMLPLVSSNKNDAQFKEEKAENLLGIINDMLSIKRPSKQMQSNIIEGEPLSSLNISKENALRQKFENFFDQTSSNEGLSRDEKNNITDMKKDLPNKFVNTINIDSPYQVLNDKKLKNDAPVVKKKGNILHNTTKKSLDTRNPSLQIPKTEDLLKKKIENLIDELASTEGLGRDEKNAINNMKKDLAKKFMNKIWDISSPSKVLHDNFKRVLRDNIEELINSLPINAVTNRKISDNRAFMEEKAGHLYDIIKDSFDARQALSQEPKSSHDVFKENVENFIDKLASYEGLSRDEKNSIKNMKKDLAKKFGKKMEDVNSPPKVLRDNFTNVLKDDIEDLINYLPINAVAKTKIKSDAPFMKEKSEHLYDIIIENLNTRQSPLQVPTGSHNILKENIDNFFDELAASENLSNLEKNKIKNMKNYLTDKLMTEINDLNSQSKILHDDFQDVVQDKIDKIINILPLSTVAKRKLKNGKQFTEEIAERLLDIIRKRLNLRSPSLHIRKSCQDILGENIENLFDELISRNDLNDEDKNKIRNVKEDLTYRLMSEIGDLYSPSKINNNFQNMLQDKFNEIIDTLPIYAASKRKLKSDKNVMGEETSQSEEFITNRPNIKRPSKQLLKNSQDILQENLEKWFDELISSEAEGVANEEINTLKNIKSGLVPKLMNKINELNMDPEVLHDDFLYEHLLRDKVDQIISTIPISKEAKNRLKNPVENLIRKIKEGKKKAENELAGKYYRQQLKESLSKNIPHSSNMSLEEKAELEMLIDKLANDFTNLLYVGDDSDKKNEYKDGINKEIRNFVKKNVANSVGNINIEQLNKDLYNTLKQVPVPADDSMKSEVNELKIKDILSKFVTELPLIIESQQNKREISKLISGFSKNINQIEDNFETDKDMNYDELINDEISKFFTQLPFKDMSEVSLQELKEKLANQIRNSQRQRRKAVKRSSINFDDEHMCPYYKMLLEQICDSSCISQHKIEVPKSNLNTEDKALLHKIMERNSYQKKLCVRDTCIGPPPSDSTTQTEPIHEYPNFNRYSRCLPPKAVCPDTRYEDKATCVLSDSKNRPLETCPSRGRVLIPHDNQEHLRNRNNLIRMQSGCCTPSTAPYRLQRGFTPIIQRPCIPRIIHSGHHFNRNPCTVIPKPTSYCRPSCNVRTRTCPSAAVQTPAGLYPSRAPCRPFYRIGCIDQTESFKNWQSHLKMRQSREKILESDLTDSDQCISRIERKASKLVQERIDERRQNDNCEGRELGATSRSGHNGYCAHPIFTPSGPLQKCSRCYGTHCPYPSNLYFKC